MESMFILGGIIFLILVVKLTFDDDESSIFDKFFLFPSPSKKGAAGERVVANILSRLPESEYIVLNDMMFKCDGFSTQIDHIVISIYGIFVIETKNHSGKIYGNLHQAYWTQCIGHQAYRMYNPVVQNQKHINFLIRHFGYIRAVQDYLHPIIVFISASKFRISGNGDYIVPGRDLLIYIRKFQEKVITIEDCRKIASNLIADNIDTEEERRSHKDMVAKSTLFTNQKIMNGICPRCGGQLEKKIGKYGSFYGCSNYPECHFIHK